MVRLVEAGIAAESLCVSYQSIVEFVAATTRPLPGLGGRALLPRQDALLEAESVMRPTPPLFSGRGVGLSRRVTLVP